MKNLILIGLCMGVLWSSMVQNDYAAERRKMVEIQIEGRGITDPDTLDAMMNVPRHLFVPEELQNEAYADYPLPIGYGQTISQPYVVALMTEHLHLRSTDKALEVGTGSGYQAAVLASIVEQVYTIEIIPELAARAETVLRDCGYDSVTVKNTDGYFGWEEHHPYDAIIITAAVDHIPPPLIQQLADGGRLILPLGNPLYYQTLTVVEKQGNQLYTTHLTSVRFVPLTGYAQDIEGEEPILPETEPPQPKESFWTSWTIRGGIILFVVVLLTMFWKMKKS